MPMLQQPPAIPASRATECAMAVFGLVVAAFIAYISLDLLLDGMLTRALPVVRLTDIGDSPPAPGAVIPRPRLAPEAS